MALAGFAEGGKLWAGDSPFGVNTPLYASLGVSVLAASPPQSRRTIRVDIAVPVKGERMHNVEVRMTVMDLTSCSGLSRATSSTAARARFRLRCSNGRSQRD